jgi:ATP-dependent DNA ligase
VSFLKVRARAPAREEGSIRGWCSPGGPSRWATKRSAEWVPLKPKLVVEVRYDHFTGERFRHGTRLLRWRPDKAPKQCTMDQIRQKKAKLMALLD